MRKTERNLAVLFADVCGSTGLYERLGDAGALAAIERCFSCMRVATARLQGREVKTIGDEIMVVFNSAQDAFEAAHLMQLGVDALPPEQGVKLAIRIGFHFGPTIEDGEDVFGDTVNTAARLAQVAKAAQIITSDETLKRLSLMQRQMTRDLDAFTVKGKSADLRLFEVTWQKPEELTLRLASVAPAAPAKTRLLVRHGGREHLLDGEHGLLTLGRDAGNDVVLADLLASRTHARIERRRDKFALIDHSTNGTFVSFEGEAEFALRREETLLRGPGRLAFGHSASDGEEVVSFRLE
jgi:class 3 adenylate cyclase